MGARHVAGKLVSLNEPLLQRVADSLDLGESLETFEPPLAAVVSVPIRSSRGLQGIAMLYFTQDAALPGSDALAHLALISRALSPPLELARALETVRNAERTLQLTLAGSACVGGLGKVVAFLEDLRDRQGELRRRPDAPAWFQEEFGRLSPSLLGALSTTRSLLFFGRGEVHKESIEVEDLVAELKAEGVTTRLGPGAGVVSGDLVLLRLALRALVEQVRLSRGTPDDGPAAEIRAQAEAGQVRISVVEPQGQSLQRLPGQAAQPDARPNEDGLALVRRIAEMHAGSLTRASGAANGFTLTLLRA